MRRTTTEQLAFETVARIEAAEDAENVAKAFAELIESAGFSYSVCLKVPDAGEDPSDGMLLEQLPEGWWPLYLVRAYHPVDPVLLGVSATFRPFTWYEAIERIPGTPKTREMFAEAATFGMKDGFVVPIYEAGGCNGLVSISGESCDLQPDSRTALSLASLYLHNKLCALRRRASGVIPDLTNRESECLTWAAIGKSDWEIGQILNISAKTVNYHIENAKRKFGVPTRMQAVVVAMRHGKIRH